MSRKKKKKQSLEELAEEFPFESQEEMENSDDTEYYDLNDLDLDVLNEREMTPEEAKVFAGLREPTPGCKSVRKGFFDPSQPPMEEDMDKFNVELTNDARNSIIHIASEEQPAILEKKDFTFDGTNWKEDPDTFAKKVLEVQKDDSIVPIPRKEVEDLLMIGICEETSPVLKELTKEQLKALFYLPKHNRKTVLHAIETATDMVRDTPNKEEGRVTRPHPKSIAEIREEIQNRALTDLHKIGLNIETLFPRLNTILGDLDPTELDALNNILKLCGKADEFKETAKRRYAGICPTCVSEAISQIYQVLDRINGDMDSESTLAYAVVDKYVTASKEERYQASIGLYKLLLDLAYKGYIDLEMKEHTELRDLTVQAIEYFEANPLFESKEPHGTDVINMRDRMHATETHSIDPFGVDAKQLYNNVDKYIKEEKDMAIKIDQESFISAVKHVERRAGTTNPNFKDNAYTAGNTTNPYLPKTPKQTTSAVANPANPIFKAIKPTVEQCNHDIIAANSTQQTTLQVLAPVAQAPSQIQPAIITYNVDPMNVPMLNTDPDFIGLPLLHGYQKHYAAGSFNVIEIDNRYFKVTPNVFSKSYSIAKIQKDAHNAANVDPNGYNRPSTQYGNLTVEAITYMPDYDLYVLTPSVSEIVPRNNGKINKQPQQVQQVVQPGGTYADYLRSQNKPNIPVYTQPVNQVAETVQYNQNVYGTQQQPVYTQPQTQQTVVYQQPVYQPATTTQYQYQAPQTNYQYQQPQNVLPVYQQPQQQPVYQAPTANPYATYNTQANVQTAYQPVGTQNAYQYGTQAPQVYQQPNYGVQQQAVYQQPVYQQANTVNYTPQTQYGQYNAPQTNVGGLQPNSYKPAQRYGEGVYPTMPINIGNTPVVNAQPGMVYNPQQAQATNLNGTSAYGTYQPPQINTQYQSKYSNGHYQQVPVANPYAQTQYGVQQPQQQYQAPNYNVQPQNMYQPITNYNVQQQAPAYQQPQVQQQPAITTYAQPQTVSYTPIVGAARVATQVQPQYQAPQVQVSPTAPGFEF